MTRCVCAEVRACVVQQSVCCELRPGCILPRPDSGVCRDCSHTSAYPSRPCCPFPPTLHFPGRQKWGWNAQHTCSAVSTGSEGACNSLLLLGTAVRQTVVCWIAWSMLTVRTVWLQAELRKLLPVSSQSTQGQHAPSCNQVVLAKVWGCCLSKICMARLTDYLS